MRTIGKIFLATVIFSITFNFFVDVFYPMPTIVIASDDKEFKEDVKYSLKIIENSKSAGHLIKELQKTGQTVFIVQGKKSLCGIQNNKLNRLKILFGIPQSSTIVLGNEDNVDFPLYIILAHEMQHALDFAKGEFELDTTLIKPGVTHREKSAMDLENAMQKEFGYKIRERHDRSH